MALAKENLLGGLSSPGSYYYGLADEEEEEEDFGLVKSIRAMSNNNTSSLTSANYSNGYAFQYLEEVRNSLINFKSGDNLISFEQNQNKGDDFINCFDYTATNYGLLINNPARDEHHGDWMNSKASAVTDSILLLESGSQEAGSNLKRLNSGESMQAVKKQCTSAAATKKPKKEKTTAPLSKDPQSIAAKNRRERISERLKILQELVPNGSQVDLVTMLEKAISYVKFLQLQVKVLAADEFWPVEGGKAPNISQVREAIDALLSSQKDRSSSSINGL